MTVVVKKFGGTSVANVEKIEYIADKLASFYKNNKSLVVVVSAMHGETDKLENLAYKITNNPAPREMAALLATGEQWVISLLCLALIKRGCPAKSYTGWQLGIQTDGIYNKAKIKHIDPSIIHQDLQAGRIVVIAGFQGVDIAGNITTLGRGGSDTTAVALAAVLGAKECQIYTDVDGVYTVDPSIEASAKKLDSIDFSEMLELSGLGAKVMHVRAVELGSYYNIPIRVLSSFSSEDSCGTLIFEQKNNLDYKQITKIAILRQQVKLIITNIDYKDVLLILKHLAEFNMEFVILNSSNYELIFTINNKFLEQCKFLLKNIIETKGIKFHYIPVAKLSLIGLGLNSNPRLISKIYNILEQQNIVIQYINTSEIKVSILLNEIDLESAVKALHEAFSL